MSEMYGGGVYDIPPDSYGESNVTDKYKISGLDSSGDPSYYGYLDTDGSWYIMKLDVGSKTSTYAKGDSGYSTAWGNRVGLDYEYFNITFEGGQ